MDETERYRFEIQQAPLTVGVPTSNLLNALSWPAVLHSLAISVPRYMAYATPMLRKAIQELENKDYPHLDICYKLSLLTFLVSRMFATEKVRQLLGKNLGESIQVAKEYNRVVMQDKKIAAEDDKKLREKQRAELARIAESSKGSVKKWLKTDKKNGKEPGSEAASAEEDNDDRKSDSGMAGSGSDTDDDLALNEEALETNEEELERLQVQELISRHEYLARKKTLDAQRERIRRKADDKQRKAKLQEQIERKRAAAKKGIQDGLVSKDAIMLRSAIEKGKECNLPERIVVSASHVLELLESEATREEEANARKQKFNKLIRDSFVRTERLGRDRNLTRYWIFRGEPQKLFVERPGPIDALKRKFDAMKNGLSVGQNHDESGKWFYYSSQAEVTALIEALDSRIPREAQLLAALNDNLELITQDMPVSKPGLLISDLLNDESTNTKKRQRRASNANEGSPIEFLSWRNELKTWRKRPHETIGVESLQIDLLEVESWLSKRLRDLGSDWQDRAEHGRSDWLKAVKSMESVKDCIAPLLALESEAMKIHSNSSENSNKNSATATENGKTVIPDHDKSDDEDDDEDDLDMGAVDDGTFLWPTKQCRTRWVEEVKNGHTIATLSVALASFVQRLEIVGVSELSNEDVVANMRRAKSEKEKRSRKERAAKKKQKTEEAEHEEDTRGRDSMDDEWDEDCYICSEGGELLCCDGCPRVFHYTCVGLRRIPRGKTFCHMCDNSVKPVVPAHSAKQTIEKGSATRQQTSSKSKAIDVDDEEEEDDEEEADAASTDHSGDEAVPKHSADQWDVECSVCSLGGELLCCEGCPRAFHLDCIGLKVNLFEIGHTFVSVVLTSAVVFRMFLRRSGSATSAICKYVDTARKIKFASTRTSFAVRKTEQRAASKFSIWYGDMNTLDIAWLKYLNVNARALASRYRRNVPN